MSESGKRVQKNKGNRPTQLTPEKMKGIALAALVHQQGGEATFTVEDIQAVAEVQINLLNDGEQFKVQLIYPKTGGGGSNGTG